MGTRVAFLQMVLPLTLPRILWTSSQTMPVFGLPQPAARRGCALIYKAITEGDKLTPTQQFKEYVDLAQKERQYYLDSMKKAEESIKSASETPSCCHYTFGFAKCCKFLTMLDRLDHCISKFLWKYDCLEYVMMETLLHNNLRSMWIWHKKNISTI